jgi:hypothetical protein
LWILCQATFYEKAVLLEQNARHRHHKSAREEALLSGNLVRPLPLLFNLIVLEKNIYLPGGLPL